MKRVEWGGRADDGPALYESNEIQHSGAFPEACSSASSVMLADALGLLLAV
jgi:hypothetical protein